ncbi:nitrilase-related carbon-nitrogen hydrolase [uncultured Jannaschia sp.]|uniref:nitrilase-related carbon-nitrogen hydrolase n=1 Tax=uncultured Jannaschia sp. TaxID=293347 RepID=UPI002637F2AD|nr:nitrilase-related carbon-nitrogen hydrolase [uncultured Jannaschia sp.]
MKVAIWQTLPHDGLDAACRGLDRAARTARGADVLLAPEMVLGGYAIDLETIRSNAAQAETLIAEMARIAIRHDIAIVCGLALPGEPLPRNAAIAVDRTGRELARYVKTHLYGPTDGGRFTAGNALSPVFDLAGWRVALAICYDIEFPELARSLALRGADAILAPTANMRPFDSVATRLVPARAEENAVYVAYANYVGTEGGVEYGGLSCICGPDGEDLARGGGETAGILEATLSRKDLDRIRIGLHHRADRRSDLYT